MNTQDSKRSFIKGVIGLLTTIVRSRLSCVAAGTMAAALSVSQPVLADHAVGTEGWAWWGQHQCLHVWNGAAWSLNGICGTSDPNDNRVWNLYSLFGNGSTFKADARNPGWFHVYFGDGKGGTTILSVPNRGSIASMFLVGPESIFLWGVAGQRWYSFAELAASANVQPVDTYTSGAFVLGGDTGITSARTALSDGTFTIGGRCIPISGAQWLVLTTANPTIRPEDRCR